MKRCVLAFVFLALLPLAAFAQSPGGAMQDLTLAEAVRVALEKNPTVQAADAYAQAVHLGLPRPGPRDSRGWIFLRDSRAATTPSSFLADC